jgi:hypothetical protein
MYSIVRQFTLDKLAKVVNEMMEEGWVPTGGVFPCSEYDWFGQAMTKAPAPPVSSPEPWIGPILFEPSAPAVVLDPVQQTDIVVAIPQRPVERPMETPTPASAESPAPPNTKRGRR